MQPKFASFLTLIILSLTFITCKKDKENPPTEIHVATIEISASSLSIGVGDTLKLNAIAKDASGNVLRGKNFTWTSSDVSVAVVDKGVVIGKKEGNATVSASTETKSGTIQIIIEKAISIPHNFVLIKFGSDVPEISQNKVIGFYSALGYAKRDTNAILPLIKDKEENLIFALDNQSNIILMSLVSGTKAQIDAASTALALVRFALNQAGTGDLKPSQLNQSIRSTLSFSQLQNVLQQNLISGSALFDDPNMVLKVVDVAKEVLIASKGLVEGRPAKRDPSEKHDIINTIWKGENLWFQDVTGSDIKLFNDTRLDWIVTSRNESGTIIDEKTLPWLPFKLFEFITALNPPTETNLTVVKPSLTGSFSLTLRQNTVTRGKHSIYLMQNLGLSLLAWVTAPGSGVDKQIECSGQFAQAVLNEKLPGLLTKADASAAKAYFFENLKKIDYEWTYQTLSKCDIPMPKDVKELSSILENWFFCGKNFNLHLLLGQQLSLDIRHLNTGIIHIPKIFARIMVK